MSFDDEKADKIVSAADPEKVFPKWKEQPLVKAAIAGLDDSLDQVKDRDGLRVLLFEAFKAGHAYGGAGLALGLIEGMMKHRPSPVDEAMAKVDRVFKHPFFKGSI